MDKGRRQSKKSNNDSENSSKDSVLVEYNFSDTFSSLLEKCLLALSIKGNDSTTRSKDESSQGAGSHHDSEHQVNVTRQALLYDKNHVLINMVREIKEGE